MKRNFMKKAVAVSLSAAMAFSLSSATALMTASAASTVTMAKTASVKVGKTKKLKLTKNTKKWTVKAVSSTNKKYCTIKKVNSKTVQITGKKATAKSQTVVVRVRVKSPLKTKTKVLKCKVTVKGTTTNSGNEDPTPSNPGNEDPTPVIETEKTVSSQAQLDAALADSNVTKITIRSAGKVELKAEGEHKGVKIIVDDPEVSVDNTATFDSIEILQIAGETWKERGKGNKFTFSAPSGRIDLDGAADVESILVTGARTVLTLTGKAANPTPVTVDESAKDSVITSSAPIKLITSAEITLTLEESATGSTVTMRRGTAAFSITFNNKTNDPIDIVREDTGAVVGTAPAKSDNYKTPELPAAETSDPGQTDPGQTTPGTTTTTPSQTVGFSSKTYLVMSNPSVSGTASVVTASAVNQKDAEITVTPLTVPVCEIVSGSSVNESEIHGVDVEYVVTVSKITDDDDNGEVIGAATVAAGSSQTFTLKGTGGDTLAQYKFKVKVEVYTKANDTYSGSKRFEYGTLEVTVPNTSNTTPTYGTWEYGDDVTTAGDHDHVIPLGLTTPHHGDE